MKRLRDQVDERDPVSTAAAALLRAAEFPRASAERRQRVWRSLDHAVRPTRGHARWAAGVAVIVLTAVAGAAVIRIRARGSSREMPAIDRSTRLRSARPPAVPTAAPPTIVPPSSTPPPITPPSIIPPVHADPKRAVLKRPRPAPPPATEPDVPAARANPLQVFPESLDEPTPSSPTRISAPAPPTAQESALVLDAMKTLRDRHDPSRARRLLGSYLRDYPSGALREEALALVIEAANALDDAEAAALAREYLAHFPSGRFRALAEAARRRFDH